MLCGAPFGLSCGESIACNNQQEYAEPTVSVSELPSVRLLDPLPFKRGITVGPVESMLRVDQDYGSRASLESLAEVQRLGANWIAVTPFGRLWSLKDTQVDLDFEIPFERKRDNIVSVVAQARALGLRVLMVPHLWVETGGWRGEVDPGSADGWAEYLTSYQRFVLTWATIAQQAGVDAFSIGVECGSWSGRFGAVWERLISDVRGVFQGELTYNANWDEVGHVLFWDLLDWIGVNAFFPLVQSPDALTGDSLATQYRHSTGRYVARLNRLRRQIRRPVVFTELGYASRENPGQEPWAWPEHVGADGVRPAAQATALDVVLSELQTIPWLRGLFLWRYYADLDDVSQEPVWGFSPHGKPASQVLTRRFGQPWAGDEPFGDMH